MPLDTVNTHISTPDYAKTEESYPWNGAFYYLKNKVLPPKVCELCKGENHQEGDELTKYKGAFHCGECYADHQESDAISQFEDALAREGKLLQ